MPLRGPSQDLFKRSKQELSFSVGTGFQGGPSRKRKGYRLALWSLMASFIDALILLAISCAFLVLFSLLMKTPANAVIKIFFRSESNIMLLAQLYAVSAWVYLIATRVLTGSSIGEWACNIRLGQPHERMETRYVWRVLKRSTLIVATGVVVLPALSLILGGDLTGKLCGLRLFSLK
ncbi:RDD family protein [Bdellovibrio sp. SKB1291214]|uniref:RDD family protein n=1 Tax=Bdellovibrio sp. SKB1291214 TaxID=1732569 RepID=UPI0020CC29BE|nr:RDD family protein [Bdellovibrio sp. SKB1291214]UYL08261.1 RDD family protein [Bdellovibrio sp. SKB1291214]